MGSVQGDPAGEVNRRDRLVLVQIGMGARRVEDLAVWQLACQVEHEVFAFLAAGPALKDFDYCRQLRRSSSSPRRNLAEGFGRYLPGDFARFTRIAIGELRETRDALDDGLERRYLTPSRHTIIVRLVDRAIGACVNLVKYLDKRKNPPRRVRHKPTDEPNEP